MLFSYIVLVHSTIIYREVHVGLWHSFVSLIVTGSSWIVHDTKAEVRSHFPSSHALTHPAQQPWVWQVLVHSSHLQPASLEVVASELANVDYGLFRRDVVLRNLIRSWLGKVMKEQRILTHQLLLIKPAGLDVHFVYLVYVNRLFMVLTFMN